MNLAYFLLKCLSTAITIQSLAIKQNSNWLTALVEYVKENSATFQAMLIVENNQDPRIDNITGEILRSVPSRKISFNEATVENAKNFTNNALFKLPRQTIFILIQFSKDNLCSSCFNDQIAFISEISPPRIQPKCLLFVLHQETSILRKELLISLWSKHFLDFTILELIQKNAKTDLLLENHRIILMMHYYNPFTETYVRKKYSPKSEFFPNKLLDMNGFEMLVVSVNEPPHIYMTRNSSGYPINASGPGIRIRNAFASAMNFKIKEAPYNSTYWGRYDCDRSKTTGLIHKLAYSQIRFTTNRASSFIICGDIHERSYPIDVSQIIPILPVLFEKSPSTSIREMFFKTIIIIGSIIVLNWFLLHALRFDANLWTLSHIFQIAVAVPVHRSPRQYPERIVFGSFLMASLFFSSTLFFLLTDVKLTKNSEVKIESFDDLQSRNLQVRMTRYVQILLAGEIEDNQIIKELIKKSEIVETVEKCVEYLSEHKNIACITPTARARFLLEKYNAEKKERVLKIGKQGFSDNHLTMLFEFRSPYVERFNQVLLRLVQAGLISSLHTPQTFGDDNSLQEVEEKLATNIKTPLLFIAFCGFLCSVIVFICELLVSFFSYRK